MPSFSYNITNLLAASQNQLDLRSYTNIFSEIDQTKITPEDQEIYDKIKKFIEDPKQTISLDDICEFLNIA